MTFYLLEGYQSNYAKIVSDRKYEIDNKVIIMDQFVVISNHISEYLIKQLMSV